MTNTQLSQPVDNGGAIYFTEKCRDQLDIILRTNVTIVVAPMGYGKTSVIREFLQGRIEHLLWIPLSASGGKSKWDFCCQKITELIPEGKELLDGLQQRGFPRNSEEIFETIRELQKLQFPESAMIVVDDYQLADPYVANPLIEALAGISLGNIGLVILTRDAYHGNSQMLRIKKLLSVIDQEYFIFSFHDLEEYCQYCGLSLKPQELREIYENTEGWAAGLLLYLERYEREQVIAFPTELYEVFDREIFSNMSEEFRIFCCSVGSFRQFTYEQADYIWKALGKEGMVQYIRELRDKNSFVRYDDQTGFFTVHTLFWRFLQSRLCRLSQQQQSDIYIAGFSWLIQRERAKGISARVWEIYRQIGDRLSDQTLLEHPEMILMSLFYEYMLDNQLRYQRFRNLMEQWIGAREKKTDQERKIEGWYKMVQGIECYNDLSQMSHQFKNVQDMWEESWFIRNPVWWTMGCPSVLMMFYRNPGSLEDDLWELERCTRDEGLRRLGFGAGGAEIMRAEMLLLRGEIPSAMETAYQAEITAERYGQKANGSIAKLVLLHCAILNGDRLKTAQIMSELEEIQSRSTVSSPLTRDLIELGLAMIHMLTRRMDEIPQWLYTREGMTSHTYFFSYPICMMIFGNYLLNRGDYTRVIGMFQALSGEHQYMRHALFEVYVNIYMAAAHHALGSDFRAYALLTAALDMGIQDRIYLPFAETYDLLSDLLQEIKARDSYRGIVDQITALSGRLNAGRSVLYETAASKESASCLTKREQEIARLAFQGKTNKEIAKELFIAVSTVKRAMVVIFKKLGIHGRAELGSCRDEFDN